MIVATFYTKVRSLGPLTKLFKAAAVNAHSVAENFRYYPKMLKLNL
jgi:hypothetical protein